MPENLSIGTICMFMFLGYFQSHDNVLPVAKKLGNCFKSVAYALSILKICSSETLHPIPSIPHDKCLFILSKNVYRTKIFELESLKYEFGVFNIILTVCIPVIFVIMYILSSVHYPQTTISIEESFLKFWSIRFRIFRKSRRNISSVAHWGVNILHFK